MGCTSVRESELESGAEAVREGETAGAGEETGSDARVSGETPGRVVGCQTGWESV